MRRRIEVGCLFLLIAGSATAARADLVVSISSPTVAAGGTGVLDVYLSSTATTTPDMINDYNFTLQITQNQPAGQLEFASNPPSNPEQSYNYLNNSSYVFYRDSADWIAGVASPPPSGGTPFTNVTANDSFLGFDNTNDFASFTLSKSSPQILLAQLTLDASITSMGESFTVSLVPGTGDGSEIPFTNSTFFGVVDSDFNKVSGLAFTSSSGTVTIGPAAVPEPSSIVCGLSAVAILACFQGKRRYAQRKSRSNRA
jgi:hypothetical protein